MLLKLENLGPLHFSLENTLRSIFVVKGQTLCTARKGCWDSLREMGIGNKIRKEGWDFGCQAMEFGLRPSGVGRHRTF